MKQENGLAQGSVLSVTLFLVAINGLLETIMEQEDGVNGMLYADDLVMYATGGNIEEILQQKINILNKWTLEHVLEFSQQKTKSMHFCRRNNC